MEDDILTPSQIEMVKAAFRSMDLNGDGRVSVSELCRACKQINLKLTRQDAIRLLKEVDSNGDGYLDFNEFKHMMKELIDQQKTEDDYLQHVFSQMDNNGDGHVTVEELVRVMNLSKAEAEELIRETDTDGDGRINFEEFVEGYRGRHDES